MPDTTPLGIQFPTRDDYVRTGSSNVSSLAQDMQNLASTTDTAIRTRVAGIVEASLVDVTTGKQILDHQLNNLDTPGRYRQISNTHATPENNYPFPYVSDIEVYPVASANTSNVQQKVFGAPTFGGGIAVRSRYLGTWSDWDIYRPEAETLQKVEDMFGHQMPGGKRTYPITLAFPGGPSSVDSRTDVQVRVPVKLPATTTRWRVHLRNRNDRMGNNFTGALNLTGVGIGQHSLDAYGDLTGNFTATPETVSGPESTPADASEWVSPWVDYTLRAYEEYLLSYGFTCEPQDNHAGYGTAWTTNDADDVFVAAPTGAELTRQPLLDVWIEAEFPSTVPAVAYWGSSSVVGIGAKYAGYQSPAMVHALSHGVIPVIYGHSGSAMHSWRNSTAKDKKWNHLSKPDALLWMMGGNDLSAATDLADMQNRFFNAYPVITAATSTNVHLVTMTPRYGTANTPEFTALRQEYNSWLETLPGGAVACWDINERVTNADDTSLLEKYAALPDTGHMNEVGYARSMTGVTAPLAAAQARQ